MKDSVKLAATKFQAWKRENPDEGYQYDEIQEFTSSLSRGELLEVFEWLETSYPIVVPEQVDREKSVFGYDWVKERLAMVEPEEGSFMKKMEYETLERIKAAMELARDFQDKAIAEFLKHIDEQKEFKGVFNR